MTTKRVWVTGATGFVGRALVEYLAPRDLPVVPVSRSAERVAGLAAVTPCTACEAFGEGDCVVYAAGLAHVTEQHDEAALAAYRTANRDEPVAMARAAARRGARRFVYISSIKVLGDRSEPGQALSEASPAAPEGPYARSKWEAECDLRALASQMGLEVVIVRPALVYGPGVGANFAAMMRWLQRGIPLPLASVDNRRSFMALGSFLALLNLCLTHPSAAGEVFVASDREAWSTPALLRQVAQGLGCPARLWPCPAGVLRLLGRLTGKGGAVARLVDSMAVCPDRACSLLGWQPEPSARALARTARSFCKPDE